MSDLVALIRTPADIELLKRDTWAGYVSDTVLGIEPDPAEARARYYRKMHAIEALQHNMEITT